jgi:hypothetical protein
MIPTTHRKKNKNPIKKIRENHHPERQALIMMQGVAQGRDKGGGDQK